MPRLHAKKRRKIIPWKSEEWHVIKGDTVRCEESHDVPLLCCFIGLSMHYDSL